MQKHGNHRFEVKIVKRQTIRITLTGSNIGRPRDYIYFVGSEDADAFANTLETAVTGAHYGRFKNSRAANVEVHGGASLEEVIVPIITLSLKKQCDLIIKLLNADAVYCDRRLGTTIQLYISDVDNTQSVSVVIDEKRYAAKDSDKTHYEVNLYDMRRAKKNVSAAIYDGDDLIGTVHFDIKGKMATVSNDFDDLF